MHPGTCCPPASLQPAGRSLKCPVGSHCDCSNPPLGVWVPREGFAAPRQPLTTCWVCRGVGFLLFPWHKSWGGSSSGSVHQGGPEEGQEGETHTMSSPGKSSFICNSSREGKRESEQTASCGSWFCSQGGLRARARSCPRPCPQQDSPPWAASSRLVPEVARGCGEAPWSVPGPHTAEREREGEGLREST